MSFKTTGILAVLLALLGGYIYLFEIRGWEERERAREQARKVADVQRGTVSRLKLETPSNRIEAVKEGFVWRITSPIETRGDYEMFESLLVASETLEKADIAADSAQVSRPEFSLADYGLLNPAIRLTFADEGGQTQQVAFGDESPTGVFFYVQVHGDDRVYLAEQRYYNQFDLSLHDLRDKRYVRFDPDLLASIELRHGDQRISVQKSGLSWRMIHPYRDLGDDPGIGQFLTDLRDARVETFVDPDPSDSTGLDDPWFSISLTNRAGEKNGLAFGRKTGSRAYRKYLAKAFGVPHVFEADSSFVHHLIESGDHFRTKDVFTFDRHGVDRIEMEFPDSALAFDKRGYNEWTVSSHPDHTIPGHSIEDFLDEIDVLRAMTYVAEEMSPDRREVFEENGIRIKLFGRNQLLREIVVGALGKHLFAATNDREQIVEIERAFLGRIRDVRIHPKTDASQG